MTFIVFWGVGRWRKELPWQSSGEDTTGCRGLIPGRATKNLPTAQCGQKTKTTKKHPEKN